MSWSRRWLKLVEECCAVINANSRLRKEFLEVSDLMPVVWAERGLINMKAIYAPFSEQSQTPGRVAILIGLVRRILAATAPGSVGVVRVS